MSKYFSGSANGFFDSGLRDSMPHDAVAISDEVYGALFDGQAHGKVIATGADGYPFLQEPPPPTAEQIRTAKVALVQGHLDERARALGYDSIANAITYAEEPAVKRFQEEGGALRAWRSLVWEACYALLADVESGNRPIPADDDLIQSLPVLALPTAG